MLTRGRNGHLIYLSLVLLASQRGAGFRVGGEKVGIH